MAVWLAGWLGGIRLVDRVAESPTGDMAGYVTGSWLCRLLPTYIVG